MQIIATHNDSKEQFLIEVSTAEELQGILTRNQLITEPSEEHKDRYDRLFNAWFNKLDSSVAIINPKYLLCSLRVPSRRIKPRSSVCPTCGQDIPNEAT